MKPLIILAFLIACPALALAEVSNLNSTSSMADQGIEPAVSPGTVLDGIPLMKGLQLVTDEDLIKVLPDSRTLQPVVSVGLVDVDDVYNFYKRVLPPLGWKATSGRDYVRNNETLNINAHANDKTSTVTFTESVIE